MEKVQAYKDLSGGLTEDPKRAFRSDIEYLFEQYAEKCKVPAAPYEFKVWVIDWVENNKDKLVSIIKSFNENNVKRVE